MVAAKEGKPIPPGWALDAQGQPTTDAEGRRSTGSMLPIGAVSSPKGAMLALVVELLVTALIGAQLRLRGLELLRRRGQPARASARPSSSSTPARWPARDAYLDRLEVLVRRDAQGRGRAPARRAPRGAAPPCGGRGHRGAGRADRARPRRLTGKIARCQEPQAQLSEESSSSPPRSSRSPADSPPTAGSDRRASTTRRRRLRLRAPQFVGAATCAACHAKETEAWRGSDHDLAMQDAERRSVLGNFDNAKFRTRARRRSSRATASSSSTPTAPTASAPTSRSSTPSACGRCSSTWSSFPAAACRRWHRLGRAAEGAGRPALVPPLSRPQRSKPGDRAALDRHRPELELPVRRVPLDQPAQEFRRGAEHVQDDVVGDQRGVRGLPRAGLEPRRVGEEGTARGGVCRGKGLAVALDERRGATWSARERRATPRSAARRATRRARSRPARAATRAPRASPTTIAPAAPLGDTHRRALLEEGLYWPDGQQRDEVYNWGSFLQSQMYAQGVTCSRLPRAALAQAARARQRGVRAVPRGRRRSTPTAHTHHAQGTPGARARPATCRRRPTWWSTRATTTRCASRVPTSPSRSACRTPATTATRSSAAVGGASRRHAVGQGRAKGYQSSPRRCRRHVRRARRARQAADADRRSARSRPSCARARIERLALAHADARSRRSRARSTIPTRSVRTRRGRARSPAPTRRRASATCRACSPTRCASCAWRRRARSPACRRRACRRSARGARAGRSRSTSPRSASTPTARRRTSISATCTRGAATRERAIAEFRQAIAIDPDVRARASTSPTCYRSRGAEAKPRRRCARPRAQPAVAGAASRARARARAAASAWPRRWPSCAQAAKLAPDDARYAYVYAVALDGAQQAPKAKEVLEAAHKRHPIDRQSSRRSRRTPRATAGATPRSATRRRWRGSIPRMRSTRGW